MPEKVKIPPDIAKLSFEEALAQLEDIVESLEGGQGKLEEAIGSYERGALLKRHCEAKLREAKEKVERIVVADGGEAAGVEPFDED